MAVTVEELFTTLEKALTDDDHAEAIKVQPPPMRIAFSPFHAC